MQLVVEVAAHRSVDSTYNGEDNNILVLAPHSM